MSEGSRTQRCGITRLFLVVLNVKPWSIFTLNYQMKKKHLLLLLAIITFIGCAKEKKSADGGYKKFLIEGVRSPYDIKLMLPTFFSARDLIETDGIVTTNWRVNRTLSWQYDNPESYCFFDSVDASTNMLIKAGPRVDIGKDRDPSFFTVPATQINKIFPPESAIRKIIYESGEKKHKEKTYYKRTYQITPDSLGVQQYFYITTKWQSTLVILNSPQQVDFDKHILDYEVHPKPGDNN